MSKRLPFPPTHRQTSMTYMRSSRKSSTSAGRRLDLNGGNHDVKTRTVNNTKYLICRGIRKRAFYSTYIKYKATTKSSSRWATMVAKQRLEECNRKPPDVSCVPSVLTVQFMIDCFCNAGDKTSNKSYQQGYTRLLSNESHS